MKHKIPTSLIVFGLKVTVTIVDKLGELRDAHGLYIPKTKQIMIDKETSQDKELGTITLLHECFHAHCDRLSLGAAGLPHEIEEILADTYPQTLLDNFTITPKRKK